MSNPSGLCLCGCGGETPLAKQTDRRYGTVKDEPVQYLPGHQKKRVGSPDTDTMRLAWQALNHAVRIGKVVKPSQCENCRRTVKVNAHHDDYTKPLDVRWLCHQCHSDEHD